MSLAHAFFSGLKAPLHISHRGGALISPENTMIAFERALREFNTDMLELDVHATRDGEVVVAHDPTVDRCTNGSGLISNMTTSELRALDAGFRFADVHDVPYRGRGAVVPLLREVLQTWPRLRINVEVKDAKALDPFVALVEKEQCLDRMCIGAEDDAIGRALTERLPEALHFYPRNALAGFVLPLKAGDEPEDDGRYTVLDMPLEYYGVTLFDAALANEAAKRGKWVNVWTVDDANDMRRVIAEGVGGVMTDRPDVLRQVLAAG